MVVVVRSRALAHQAFLVLLSVCCLGSIGLAMDIVRRIFVNGTGPVQSMLVDQVVIIIQGVLPVIFVFVKELLRSLPSREPCISLSASKMCELLD